MPAVDRILTSARIDLGDPVYPSRRELLDHLLRRQQFYVNDLRMTDEGWLLREFAFDPDGSTDTYPITAPGFAGDYLVTTDPLRYSDHRRREVATTLPTSMNLISAPDWLVTTEAAEPDSVAAIAFFARDGRWWARVKPGNAAGHYTVLYEPGLVAETPLENLPELLQQFWPLLATATACDGLGVATWAGMDEAGCQAKRAGLEGRLAQKEQELYVQFKRYIRSVNQPQTKFRTPFETSPGMADPYTRGRRRW